MRKVKRKMVLEWFRIIHKMHNIFFEEKSRQSIDVNEIFKKCQGYAIQIGCEIEYWEGEGNSTVKFLEDYCEEVYQCSQLDRLQDGLSIFYRLEECLNCAENSFLENISNDKLEIVFFPYNASMWYSLASVWDAANAHERCDAYVVPIPYFEKNPDGSFGKMHYEGDKLPADVPIIPWEEYDYVKRCPDIVFIHNPYDENNFVTSVHPNYYASVLKKYTDNLVYIPYYLFVDNRVYETTFITNGILYADYVIVQSKESCRDCINLYDNFLQENGLAGKLKSGTDKFIPLGSPIIDSLLNTLTFDKIPLKWQEIIKKKGNHPKVIMYNTHLSNVMGPIAESFFRKIKKVLDIFKSQDDIVLLWRPHPLTWQTIHSMNPGAAEEYQKIVDNYREEEWGIYDDTVELNLSIALSDAYFGDWSSLITMFLEVGKPVMVQNLGILYDG